MVALWIVWWQCRQPPTHKAGSQDHGRRAQAIERRLLVVISKDREIKIHPLAFPRTAAVLGDKKKKIALN